MKYMVVASTDIGTRKAVNQDSYLAKTVHASFGNVCMALICDGMGGLEEGEKASQTVAALFNQWFNNELKNISGDILDRNTLDMQIESILKKANQMLVTYGDKKNIKVGTTASIIIIVDEKYYTYHVGDTRIYRQGSLLSQLTEDHTLVASKVKNGQITKEEAKVSREKHILLQCVGVNNALEIHKSYGTCNENDVFLLCCDGFYNKLSEEELSDMLIMQKKAEKSKMQELTEEIIQRVKTRGETDNISALVVKLL